MYRMVIAIVLGLLATTPAWAQPEVDALRVYLGTSGSTCTLHSGSGAPSTSLGAVCDIYVRVDSPYTVYTKTGGSTWTSMVAVTGVATGSVLVSAGVGAQPAYTSSPTIAGDLTIDSTNAFAWILGNTPSLSMTEEDASAGNQNWAIQSVGEQLQFSAYDDAFSTRTDWLAVDRTANVIDSVALDATTLKHTDYVSQTTSWGITDVGAADFRYLFTDELHARSFIADLEQALAGLQIITKSVAILQSDFTCPAAAGTATLSIEDLPGAADMQVFDANDWVAVRSFSRAAQTLTIGDCVGQVSAPNTTPSGYQTWTFTRGSGGSAGSMTASTVVARGTVVLDYGVSGAGYYEVNAVDGVDGANSPYSQVVTWATAPVAANRTVRTRIGNLNGSYDYASTTWGAAFGDKDAAWVKIDPTNGVRIGYDATTKIQLDASGNASFAQGAVAIDSTGISVDPYSAGAAWSAANAYLFTIADSEAGLMAYDFALAGRTLLLHNNYSGADITNLNIVSIQAKDDSSGSTGSASAVATFRAQDSTSDYASINLAAGTPASSSICYSGDSCVALHNDAHIWLDAPTTNISGEIVFRTDVASPTEGSITENATNGLSVRAKTGSSYDFAITDQPNTSYVLRVPTGTAELYIGGVGGDGTGKVVCVKADTTLGTCTTQPNASGVCTCS